MRGRLAGTAVAFAVTLALVAELSQGDAATGDAASVEIGTFAPDSPTYVTAPSGDGERLFVTTQQGRIRVVRSGAILPTPFLTVAVACCGERGLLSMAFAPDYVLTGQFYVFYTAPDGALTVDEYRRSGSDPDLADPLSRRVVLSIPHPRGNHNGGQLQFGPDGYLYVGTGDGGGTGDPDRAGQDLTTVLGKVLRIDPRAGPAGAYRIPADNPFVGQPPRRPEIWSYGLRNPWRFSFDRHTGDLVIADVGQATWEEIDFSLRSLGYGRGTNFGWSCREGRHAYDPAQPLCATPPVSPLTEPVWEYSHSRGCSITGGYVVRDPAFPALFGRYVYGDACTAPLWSLVLGVPEAQGDATTGDTVSSLFSFGEDACARVYAASGLGPVYRLGPAQASAACSPVGGTLIASVGPGSELMVRDPQGNDLNGRALPVGTYTVQVDDLSDGDNLHLFGPAVHCVPPSDCATEIAGTGRETWLVTFTPGTATVWSDAHPATQATFTVGPGPVLPPPPTTPPSPPSASPPSAPAPKPTPRYQATVRTTHPRAIRDRSRNWTYRGDIVRVAFRNAAAPAGERRRYKVCHTRNRAVVCGMRTLRGRAWDAWKLRIRRPWAGYVKGRYRRYVEFTWRVSSRTVARKRIWIYR
jgi:glucose/arabinose dehydrogenase